MPGKSGGMPPMAGKSMSAPPPFRARPQAQMMADGGDAPMGAPPPIGGAPDAAAPPVAPPAAPQADPGNPTVKPESVNYHDDPQQCQTCMYMDESGQCAVLKMQVSPEGACNAYEPKGGDQGGAMGDPDMDQDMDQGGPPTAGAQSPQ